MTQESYEAKLARHSSESRYDPLRDAARRVLAAWEADDDQEKNDLSEELWNAMGNLAVILRGVKRGGEEEVPEVEVTYDRSSIHAEAPVSPPAVRRSGAKNISAPEYQDAFISEARHSMGQPTKAEAEDYLGDLVVLIFNAQSPRQGSTGPLNQARGILTRVVDHPSGSPTNSVYLMLDDDKDAMYPLNSVQEIRRVR